MEVLCPECLAPLQASTPSMLRCSAHGGVYRLLFARTAPRASPAVPPPAASASAAGVRCPRHPAMEAGLSCTGCGSPLCPTCAFPGPLCPDCATRQEGSLATPLGLRHAAPINAHCARHPGAAAVALCTSCRKPVCSTCRFSFPGDVDLCPACATAAPAQELSPSRRNYGLATYGLAALSTLACFVAFAILGGEHSKEAETGAEVLFSLFGLIPSLVGLGLGFSAIDRRMHNPWWLWGGVAWNGLLVGAYVLLSLIGTLSG